MTISGSFPGDSELISSFPAQKRAEGDTLLVDHTSTGTHNKVSLIDRDGSTPTGIPAGVLAIWQEDGVLRARLGAGPVTSLGDFIQLTGVLLAQASNLRPIRVLRAAGESRRIAFVNADGDTWGYLGISSTGTLVLEVNDAAGGSAAAGIDVQPGGVINAYQGELRVANNAVIHAGNLGTGLTYTSNQLQLRRFESNPITVTSFTDFATSVTHGLSARPWAASYAFRALNANNGYAIGDELSNLNTQTEQDHDDMLGVWTSATHIGFALRANLHTNAPVKAGGAFFNLDTADWALILRAWQ